MWNRFLEGLPEAAGVAGGALLGALMTTFVQVALWSSRGFPRTTPQTWKGTLASICDRGGGMLVGGVAMGWTASVAYWLGTGNSPFTFAASGVSGLALIALVFWVERHSGLLLRIDGRGAQPTDAQVVHECVARSALIFTLLGLMIAVAYGWKHA